MRHLLLAFLLAVAGCSGQEAGTVAEAEPAPEPTNAYPKPVPAAKLELVGQPNYERTDDGITLSGIVQNTGDVPADEVRITFTVYDKDSVIVATATARPAYGVEIPPGRKARYETTVHGLWSIENGTVQPHLYWRHVR